MRSLRVAVIGGGPAGLYAARLLKRRHPRWDVTVFECQPPGATFGFGVALHRHALRRLETADAQSIEEIAATGHPLGTWTLRRGSQTLRVVNDHGFGVSRVRLLGVLEKHARAAGVRMETGRVVSLDDVTDADLVIGADGVGSATRKRLANELGVTLESGKLAYIWCGADLPIDGMLLSLAQTTYGALTTHVMPYGDGRCTFQVDADTETVKQLGPGESSERSAQRDSDHGTLALLERVFADILEGQKLRSNRSRWATFTTVTCRRWSHGNVVLIGDAAHTAHYTVGSGTRLAMEDAADLADALDGAESLTDAFLGFEQARRPAVSRLQWRAERSQTWWSSIGARVDLPLPQLFLSYLSRTGATRLSDLASTNGELVADCMRAFAGIEPCGGDIAEQVLAQPFQWNDHSLATRVVDEATLSKDRTVATLPIEDARPWSEESQRLVARARGLADDGVSLVRLTGPPERRALLDRLDVAEQLRLQAGVSTIVAGPSPAREDLALGLLAGRADLVEVPS
jgi:anthraniloyl-CoA monooxygenase